MNKNIIIKVIATLLNIIVSFIIGIIVPREIGPISYGEYNYIIATFAFLFQFFILNSNTGYIFFLSNNKYKTAELNFIYYTYIFLVFLIILAITFFSINTELGTRLLWSNLENKYLIFLGLIFGILTFLQQRFIEFADCKNDILRSEKLKIVSRVLLVITIVFAISLNYFNLKIFFILSITSLSIYTLSFFIYITSFKINLISLSKLIIIIKEFYSYLKPLIVFSLVSSLYAYLGRYVLQTSSGSLEQGYYSFSFQLSLIPMTFIYSLMTIYLNEMTKKFEQNDLKGVKKIFVNNIYIIYTIYSFLTLFLFINAKEVILITVGIQYLPALPTLQILLIFSLLQTFGLLNSNIYYSTKRNKEFSIINSFVMTIGIFLLLYILFFKNTLTAIGLATIMCTFYFIRISIQLFYNTRFLSINLFILLKKIFFITLIMIVVFHIFKLFFTNLILNLIFSSLFLLTLNFLLNDFIKIKSIKKVK